MANLFITGSSGFIATHLAERLDLKNYGRVYFLSRTESPVTKRLCEKDNVEFIQGSIYDADRYARQLEQTDTVVHCAAVTGKARPEAYFDTNAKGTDFFVQQCERAGVQNFLHISTIAVNYPDVSHYHYAQSKQQAEEAVRRSRLPFTIVRPTIVLGQKAPIWKSLSTLAQGPFIPVFGDGKTLVQPIHVDDLVTVLLAILDERLFDKEAYDLGGPDRLTIEDLLQRIHRIYSPKVSPVLHLPLKLIIPVLSVAEKVILPLLPFTVGQLSLFRYDSIVERNRLHDKHAQQMNTVDDMLKRRAIAHQADQLDQEGRVFCNYLIGQDPSVYMLTKYREGHAAHGLERAADANSFDRLLVRMARKGPRFARLTDTYTSLFYGTSVLRKKLILLLAILECSAPTNQVLDAGRATGKMRYYLTLFTKGFGFAFRLLLSTLLFLPWHLLLKRSQSTHRV